MRRELGSGFAADREFDDEGFFAQQLEEFLAAVERRGFQEQDGEGRGRGEIFAERVEDFVARFVAELFDGFGGVYDDYLALRQHGQRLGALEDFVPAGFPRGKPGQGPAAEFCGHVGIDDAVAAHVAEIGIGAEQDDGSDRLAVRDAAEQLFGRYFRHQNPSTTLATKCEAKSRDMRSSAGSSSWKKLFTSGVI